MVGIKICLLSIGLLGALGAGDAFAAGGFAPLDAKGKPLPPSLVACDPDNDCDMDEEDLVQFLRDFYDWYVADNDQFAENLRAFLDRDDRAESHGKQLTRQEQIVRERLTPDFWGWKLEHASFEGEDDEAHCPSDTDYIMCASEWDEGQVHRAFWHARSLGAGEAVFSGEINSADKISVKLKAWNGFWRLDAVSPGA